MFDKIYRFITPSDPITFRAKNDKIAYAVTIIIGNGKAGCDYQENGKEISLPTMLMFVKDSLKEAEDYLGQSLKTFLEENMSDIIGTLKSFAYGSTSIREEFDLACESITDQEKLKDFKQHHEDFNRSSVSEWVKYAWGIAENMAENQELKHAQG